MKLTYYVPIYEWANDPDGVHGGAHGCTIYYDLNELYGIEQDAVGHFEVIGTLPTENEFKTKIRTRSDAV